MGIFICNNKRDYAIHKNIIMLCTNFCYLFSGKNLNIESVMKNKKVFEHNSLEEERLGLLSKTNFLLLKRLLVYE